MALLLGLARAERAAKMEIVHCQTRLEPEAELEALLQVDA